MCFKETYFTNQIIIVNQIVADWSLVYVDVFLIEAVPHEK